MSSVWCRELGIGIVPYSPLGRGFFSGKAITESLEASDRRLVRDTATYASLPFLLNLSFAESHMTPPAQCGRLDWVAEVGVRLGGVGHASVRGWQHGEE